MEQQPQTIVITKEPTCCGCFQLRCGAITLIVWSIVCAISWLCFSLITGNGNFVGICELGLGYLGAAICVALALHLRTKIICYATAGCLTLASSGHIVVGFSIILEYINITDDTNKLGATLMVLTVLHIIQGFLNLYFAYVWIEIGGYFEKIQLQAQTTPEPKCCGCCGLRFGTIALIVVSIICAMFNCIPEVSGGHGYYGKKLYDYIFSVLLGVCCLGGAICGALALHLRTKIMGYIAAGSFGVISVGSSIAAALVIVASVRMSKQITADTNDMGGLQTTDQAEMQKSIRTLGILWSVFYIICSLLYAYCYYVWVQIGEYFGQSSFEIEQENLQNKNENIVIYEDQNTAEESIIVQTIQLQGEPQSVQDVSGKTTLTLDVEPAEINGLIEI